MFAISIDYSLEWTYRPFLVNAHPVFQIFCDSVVITVELYFSPLVRTPSIVICKKQSFGILLSYSQKWSSYDPGPFDYMVTKN